MRTILVIGLALALGLAGCGDGDGDEDAAAPSTSSPSLGAPIPGGGLTVQEALDSDLDGPLLVKGYLIERDGELHLCSAILESYPPQCGKPSLRIDGSGLAPSEEQISLLGEVEAGTITVSETATG